MDHNTINAGRVRMTFVQMPRKVFEFGLANLRAATGATTTKDSCAGNAM